MNSIELSVLVFIVGYGGCLLGGVIAAIYSSISGTRNKPLSPITARRNDLYSSLNTAARAAARVQSLGIVLGTSAAAANYYWRFRLSEMHVIAFAMLTCLLAFLTSMYTSQSGRKKS